MFDINAAFDSLPDDLEQARRDFKTKVKELPAFGFARPSKIRQVDIIVRNRAFLQKLMMLYYLEREAVFGG
ncbi:MAG: hypothetical protein GWN67_04805, partial [Phycisphaerae bacterium]|nr:hypothetical protein [Phycisphaerae bacterium]NIV13573.1 hypothetical protein [Fodinibius sp.]NIW92197.1 hypothetical protein [Phycisphaerae bacterium]